MNKKIIVIHAKTESELAERINNLTISIFAVQPIQKTDSSWCAFVYYEPLKNEEKPDSNPNVPSDKQIFRIKDLIKKKIIKEPVDFKTLTKFQASKLLSKYL